MVSYAAAQPGQQKRRPEGAGRPQCMQAASDVSRQRQADDDKVSPSPAGGGWGRGPGAPRPPPRNAGEGGVGRVHRTMTRRVTAMS